MAERKNVFSYEYIPTKAMLELAMSIVCAVVNRINDKNFFKYVPYSLKNVNILQHI